MPEPAISGGYISYRAWELDSDEHPQAAVNQERRLVPEPERLYARTSSDHPRPGVGEHKRGHQHCDDTTGVHRLSEQERRERRQHAEGSFFLRRIERAA